MNTHIVGWLKHKLYQTVRVFNKDTNNIGGIAFKMKTLFQKLNVDDSVGIILEI